MKRLAVFTVVLLMAACSETPPTHFYTLAGQAALQKESGAASETETPTSEESSTPGITLALAPVMLPAYLDRPQIVMRLDATRMQIAEFDNWIEPLDSLIQRTMASNLQNDASIRQVIRLPQRLHRRIRQRARDQFPRASRPVRRGWHRSMSTGWLSMRKSGSSSARRSQAKSPWRPPKAKPNAPPAWP